MPDRSGDPLAPENVEWNNPGRLRLGPQPAVALERQVRLGRIDEEYRLVPAAALEACYAEVQRLRAVVAAADDLATATERLCDSDGMAADYLDASLGRYEGARAALSASGEGE